MYEFRGFHGTTACGLAGVLSAGQLQPQQSGSRGIYARCAESPTGETMLRLLRTVMKGSKSTHGLILEIKTTTAVPHVRVHGGGIDAELRASKKGTRVTHLRQKAESRWTVPKDRTQIEFLWVWQKTLSKVNVSKELRMKCAFE